MGNWCGVGTFGRVYSVDELNLRYPSDQVRTVRRRDGVTTTVTGADFKKAWIARQVGDKLSALWAWSWLYLILVLVGLVGFSVIPDYAPYPRAGLGVPHTVWAIWSLLTIAILWNVFSFGPYLRMQRVVLGLWFFYLVLLIDMFQNAAHLVLAILELARCDTALCLNTNSHVGKSFLITLVVLLSLHIIVNIFIWIVASHYRKALAVGIGVDWRPGSIGKRAEATQILNSDPVDSPVAAAAPVGYEYSSGDSWGHHHRFY